MGWGRWFLLGDFGQQWDIAEQQDELSSLKYQLHAKRRQTESIAEQLSELQRENDELKLYVAAMIRLLLAKGVVSSAEINSLVNAVDESDGTLDGKFSGDINPNAQP